MRRLPPVLLASLLLACTTDKDAGTDGTGAASTGGASTSTGAATDTTATDATATGSTTDGTGASTVAPTSTDTATGTDTGSSATTGDPGFCYGWGGDGPEPYLELHGLDEATLVDGGDIQLQCGGQGLFMFGLYPQFGGFVPPGDQITFDVVVDVEGHNTNPENHFYSVTDSGYYVGCEDIIGGVLGVVPVIPPDNEDVLTLDGLPADFHVVMHTPKGDVVIDLKLNLVVKDDGTWQFCGQG